MVFSFSSFATMRTLLLNHKSAIMPISQTPHYPPGVQPASIFFSSQHFFSSRPAWPERAQMRAIGVSDRAQVRQRG